ncbi:hypothetical protein EY01_15770, partial [Staphylococcus aureus]|uniref:hypothetical protein n=1 Tax=Staphylococcus aureus TaxID=1280 RepID=UPI00065C0B02
MTVISDIKLLLLGLSALSNQDYFSQIAEIKKQIQNLSNNTPTKEDIKFTTNRIKELAQNGVGVRVTDIDWDAIEVDEKLAEKT